MTPEGKIKRKIKEVLSQFDGLWYFMPVPYGYGEGTLDFVGCYHGRFFSIEAKAPGKEPTTLQRHTITRMRTAGARVMVIDNEASLLALPRFLQSLEPK